MNGNKYKILIIEDDEHINNLVATLLEANGYQTLSAYSCEDGMMMYASHRPDLVVLDLGLPDQDGMTFLKRLRKDSLTPVIVLSARSDEKDKVEALDMGANDYVTKPFRPLEVVARVKAQLRRYKKYSPATNAEKIQPELSYSKLWLNTQTHECLLEGEAISLTPTEFSILHVLLANAGNVVSIEDLFHVVWKDEYYSKNSSTITVHIRHLREKLKDTSDNPQYIKTIWGVGYKI